MPTLVVAGTTYVAVKTAQGAQKAGELAQEAGMQATLAMDDEGEQP